METVTASAHPNIALIKYWGNRDEALRLPANGSISFNLQGLQTRTTFTWKESLDLRQDFLTINDIPVFGAGLKRVSAFLDHVRALAGFHFKAEVASENGFPTGAGIASSASAFAALALAATRAAGLDMDEAQLSRLARRGSGSACRSIPGGFVEWQTGDDQESYAATIAAPDHWQLMDIIAVINTGHKSVGSTEGHALADTSALQASRVADTPRRLAICRSAILQRDFNALAEITEYDSRLMHTVMMTSSPPLYYRENVSLAAITAIRAARRRGLAACTTVDAGPNVHVICAEGAASEVANLLLAIPGIRTIIKASVGGAARILD